MRKISLILTILAFIVSACGGAQTTSRTSSSIGALPTSPYSDPYANPGQATPVPPAVTGLTGTYNATTKAIDLSWNPTPTATGYDVKQGGILVGQPTTNSFSFGGVVAGTTYTFTVAATNAGGAGPAATVTVTATSGSAITVSGTVGHALNGATVSIYGGASGLLGTATTASGAFTATLNITNPAYPGETLYVVTSGGTGTGIAQATAPEFVAICGQVTYNTTSTLNCQSVDEASTVLYAKAIQSAGAFVPGNTAQDTAVFTAWQNAITTASQAGGDADLIAMTTLYTEYLVGNSATAFVATRPAQFANGVLTFGSARLAGSGILPVADLDTQASSIVSGFSPAVVLTPAYVNALNPASPSLSFLGVTQAHLASLRQAGAAIVGPTASAPTAPAVTVQAGNMQITATWPPVASAASYDLFLNGTQVGNVLTSPYTFTGLTNGVPYSVGVAARNAIGVSAVTTVTATPVALPPAPSGLTATFDQNTMAITLTWNPAPGATGYNIYNGASLVGTSTGSPFTFNGAVAGTTYTFAVAGTNAAGEGASATVTVTANVIPPAPSGLTATVQPNNDVLVAWLPYNGATSYTVNVDNGVSIITTTSNNVTLTGYTAGVPHSVSVIAVVGGVQSQPATTTFTIPVTPPTPLPAPANLTASTLNASTLHITWNAVAGAASYQVTVNGVQTTVTGVFYDAGGLTSGAPISVSVAAVDLLGNVGTPATLTTVLAPAIAVAPVNLVDTNTVVGSSDATLSWAITASQEMSAQFGGYQLVTLDANPGVRVSSNATTYSFVALTAGTHTFTVQQCNDAGCGPAASLTELLPH